MNKAKINVSTSWLPGKANMTNMNKAKHDLHEQSQMYFQASNMSKDNKAKCTSRLPTLIKDHFQFQALPLSPWFSLAILFWSNLGDKSFFESLGT